MDYKQETIDKLREFSCFSSLSDERLKYLYWMYSAGYCASGWTSPTSKTIGHFHKWAYTTPLEEVMEMPESDFE